MTESGKLPDVDPPARYRIGELARLAGPAVPTLRTWQDRYPGLLRPARTAGGHRVYGDADLAAVREMQRLVAGGITVAAAAARVIARRGETPPTVDTPTEPEPPATVARTWWADSAGDEVAGLRAAHTATRAILRASTPAQVAAAVVAFVGAVGGTVLAAGESGPDTLPLDVSVGVTAPALPHAAPGSPARRRLEALLPELVEDARLAAARLRIRGTPRSR